MNAKIRRKTSTAAMAAAAAAMKAAASTTTTSTTYKLNTNIYQYKLFGFWLTFRMQRPFSFSLTVAL